MLSQAILVIQTERKEMGISWADYSWGWVVFQSQTGQRWLSPEPLHCHLSTSVLLWCWVWQSPFHWYLAGKEKMGTKHCLIDELQKPAWALCHFLWLWHPISLLFVSHCYFSRVHQVVCVMMRLLYFFPAFEGLPQISLVLVSFSFSFFPVIHLLFYFFSLFTCTF